LEAVREEEMKLRGIEFVKGVGFKPGVKERGSYRCTEDGSMMCTGVRVVQRSHGGTFRDLLVTVCRRHGRCARTPAARHVGQFPALSESQRLPSRAR